MTFGAFETFDIWKSVKITNFMCAWKQEVLQ